MTSKFRIFVVLSVFAVLLTWVFSASACPNCKEAIAAEGGEDGDGTPQTAVSDLGRAYSISVLFMLGSFLSVLIGFSSAFYWIYHSHQRTVTSGSRLNEPESLTHGDSSAYDYATSPGH